MPPKSKGLVKLIDEAKFILDSVGVPIFEEPARRAERIAMAFLAVAGVAGRWKDSKSLKDGRKLTSREVIEFVNANFEESISRGSYDDIRRKDLRKLVLGEFVINSGDNPSAKTNDPTRGYSLENDFKDLIITFGTSSWDSHLSKFLRLKGSFKDKLVKQRLLPKLEVFLPSGNLVNLQSNYHNSLQKAIIEDFLPIFGGGCEVLYVGDATNRMLLHDEEKLRKIGFFKLGTEELPDIIAYNEKRNWLFLIEAVTSSGPMSDERVFELKKMSPNCSASLIFITAFLNRDDFKKWLSQIAWETEVWIADNKTHLIHFNGDKFLGPHQPD